MNRVRETRFPAIVWCAALLAMACSVRAWAGDNKYSKFEYDSQKGVGYFDLVVSLNWVPDQAERGGKLKNALTKLAQVVYDATEGKHKLRTIRVYFNDGEKGTCDIYIANAAGRANSPVNGFGKSGARINMFTSTPEGTPRNAAAIGSTLAHEFGHYAYGLFDEYMESSMAFDNVPSMAHSTDVPCDCIMHSDGGFQEFCVEDYHSQLTAQHREHEGSCWLALSRPPDYDPKNPTYKADWERRGYEGLTNPGNSTEFQPGGDGELKIVYVEGTAAQVAVVLDRSGSMSGENKMELAKTAAKQFVDLMQIGDRVAVLAFDNFVETTWPMTEITTPPPQTDIKAAINLLYYRGETAIGDALRAALDSISTQADPNLLRGVVLLSDGYHNAGFETPQDVVPDYVAANIPVFTVGLGPDVDGTLLQGIAQQTGGTYYYSPDGADLQEIYASIAQATASNEQLLDHFEDVLLEGNVFDYPSFVDSNVEKTTFLVSWELGDIMRLELITPGGTVITPDNVAGFPGVSYAAEQQYALYRVEHPQTGVWMMRTTAQSVTSTGEISVRAQAVTDLQLSVSIDSLSMTYPMPLGIRAVLRKDLPITQAEVTALIDLPDGSESIVPLFDHGQGSDDVANDGVYSGLFDANTQDGQYAIRITATNAGLVAGETDAGLLEKGARSVWRPFDEYFTRLTETVVTVSGVVSDDHGDTRSEATPLPVNNSDHPGRIETSFDVDFFAFTVPRGLTTVTFRVTEIAKGMVPHVRIFDADGTTVLAEGTLVTGPLRRGYLNFDLSVRPGTTYYASVAHTTAEAGGIYFVSVGPETFIERDTTPPGQVRNFTATGKTRFILLEWTNPSDPDLAGVQIVRSVNGVPAGPNDGVIIYDGTKAQTEPEAEKPNKTVTFSDLQATSRITYYYAAYAYDTSLNYSTGVEAVASPRVTATRGNCFVAKASYGTPLEKDINVLRTLRDRYLLTNAPGAALVCVYYSVSPAISHGIDGRPVLLAGVRVALVPIVYFAKVFLAVPYVVLMVSLAILLLALRSIVRRSRIVR